MFEQEGNEDSIRKLIAQSNSGGGNAMGGSGQRGSRIQGNSFDEVTALADKFLEWSHKRRYLTLDGKPAHPNARRADGTMMSWDEYERGGGREREDRMRKWNQGYGGIGPGPRPYMH